MVYKRENIVEGIYSKLDEMYGGDSLYSGMLNFYKQELINYPIEVEQNVLEWINGQPLTEVDCHGVSIKRVLACRNLQIDAFPHVLRNFIKFKKSGFCNQMTCFDGFMKL